MIIQSPSETRHHLNGETLPHVGAPDDIDPISECQKTDSSCFHNFSDLIRLLPVAVNPTAHADVHRQQEAAADPTQTGTKTTSPEWREQANRKSSETGQLNCC